MKTPNTPRAAASKAASFFGLSAALLLPASAALAAASPGLPITGGLVARAPVCSAEAGPGSRNAQLCQSLAAWVQAGGNPAAVVRIEVQALRADRDFWRSLAGAEQALLLEYDAVEIARQERVGEAAEVPAETGASVHPASPSAASPQ